MSALWIFLHLFWEKRIKNASTTFWADRSPWGWEEGVRIVWVFWICNWESKKDQGEGTLEKKNEWERKMCVCEREKCVCVCVWERESERGIKLICSLSNVVSPCLSERVFSKKNSSPSRPLSSPLSLSFRPCRVGKLLIPYMRDTKWVF